jgi:flagellar assembly protein FliH
MMSTSSDFSWAGADPPIHSFDYPAAHTTLADTFEGAARPENDIDQLHAEMQTQLQRARAEGERAGELRARTAFEESLRTERRKVQQTLEDFEQERQSYFLRVETEVVQLSLSIARKVLHREAQVDKSLLAGIVRVSLGQLADSTDVVLRVHPSQEQVWNSFFSASDLIPAPRVIADASVPDDRCVISTQLGTTEIGIESQLKEIEQGLFDLMAQRPEG